MKSFCAIIFFPAIIIAFFSCSKENHTSIPYRNGCDSGTVFYQIEIKPIIQTNCFGATCHQAGTGNFDFSKYEILANNISSGRFEYRLLLPTSDPQHMPQTGPPNPTGYDFMDPCDLYKIQIWIRQGYHNN